MIINIQIRRKKASSPAARIVCGNTDYQIAFTFDSEWDAYETKTARFIWNGQYADVVFSGNVCDVPKITDTTLCMVGVFAGDLHTTTPAYIKCDRSILCGDGSPAEPALDVYAQLMEKLNSVENKVDSLEEGGGSGGGAVSWNDFGEIAEILPEMSVTIDENSLCEGTEAFALEVGGLYTLKWNGTEYSCSGQEFAVDGTAVGVALGDLGAMTGGASTGEPFLFVAIYPNMVAAMGMGWMVMALDGSTSATLSVTGFIPDPIPAPFLVNAVQPIVFKSYVEDGVHTCNYDFETCKAMVRKGAPGVGVTVSREQGEVTIVLHYETINIDKTGSKIDFIPSKTTLQTLTYNSDGTIVTD